MSEINRESSAFSQTQLNGLTLRNRVFKAATFEGMSLNSEVTDPLINFHQRVAQGGAALTTLAYCAVSADGRVLEHMLYMREAIRDGLTKLADQVHAQGAALSGQMVHCGNFTQNPAFNGKRPKGPSWAINASGIPFGLPIAEAMTRTDIDNLVREFSDAAAFMKSVGFDALEIHFGHGYGLSQFISPKTNRRNDEYGGSLFNRMRLPLRVLEAVRTAVGDDFPILGKISMTDGVAKGLKLPEAVEAAALLDQAGIDAIITSGGTSSMNPMLLFRGDSLIDGMIEQEKNWLMRQGLKWVGPHLFKQYPYQELYFFDMAKQVRDALKHAKLCYVGGVSSSQSLATVMQEFDFVQLGRALINDPEMVNHMSADASYQNACTHCNRCATLITAPGGVRCVLSNQNMSHKLDQ